MKLQHFRALCEKPLWRRPMSDNYSEYWNSLVSTVEDTVKKLNKRNKTSKFLVANLKLEKNYPKEFRVTYSHFDDALNDLLHEVQVAITCSFVNIRIFYAFSEEETADHFQLKTNKTKEPYLKNLHTGENLSFVDFADYLLKLILKP